MESKKIYFKTGDHVAHRDNISLRMEVERIIYKKREMFDGSFKNFCIGVRCRWWIGDEMNKEVYHSNTLIPWDIVEKDGIRGAQNYLNEVRNG